jgi:hypothetical protein
MLVVGIATLPQTFDESAGTGWAVVAMFVVIAGVTVWFSWLRVAVEDATLSAAFGPGRPRKSVDLSDVVSAVPVRNQWYQGWGVRKISGGWMYNVWGLDAVEFTTTSGEIVRIGTNDRDNLLASIRVFTG